MFAECVSALGLEGHGAKWKMVLSGQTNKQTHTEGDIERGCDEREVG